MGQTLEGEACVEGDNFSVIVTDHERRENGKKITLYKVIIVSDGRAITICRRYGDFLDLYDKIKKKHSFVTLRLPGKKVFGVFDPKVIRARKLAIKELIGKVVTETEIYQSDEVKTFIQQSPSRPGSFCDDISPSSGYSTGYSTDHSVQFGSTVSLEAAESGDHYKQKPEDFEFLRVIGKGNFGKVFLARNRTDDNLYAVKVLNKQLIVQKNEVRHIMSEKRVLEKNSTHPFLVTLHGAFQTGQKLYLVMDYVSGGELFFHLQRKRSFPESSVKFYGAEISSALGFLHSRKIIYRDLKPENILLDAQGHVVLTDFGLCTEGLDNTTTFCGTPEYLSPEILKHSSYDRTVDWWCLGAVLYELLFSLPPFYSKNREEMFERILKKPLEFKSNVVISSAARDFFTQTLSKTKDERLGARNDFEEVKSHQFFSSIDWQVLEAKNLPPPFIPNQAQCPSDVNNFDVTFTNLAITDSVTRGAGNRNACNYPNRIFAGFSYVSSPPEKIACF